LKSDADTGSIELELDGTVYSREYSRQSGKLISEGTQFTDQGELIELFAQVLEDNPARRAVARGDDLRDLLMRPVDTAEIERQIQDRQRERIDVDERLEEINDERERLPDLEERRNGLREEIEETSEEIHDLQDTIDEYEADKEKTERAEELLDELEDVRKSLKGTERKIEDREAEIDRLESNLEEVKQAAEDITVPEDELENVDEELGRLHRQKRDLAETIDNLERIVGFNEDVLAGGLEGFVDDISGENDAVTAALDPSSQTITCWTCGSEVERSVLDERLDGLRDIIRERRAKKQDLDAEISELEDRKQQLQQRRDEKREVETRRERLEEQISFQTGELEELREEREDLQTELDTIDTRVEETKELRESDLVETYQRLSELEYERGQLESDLERIEDEIEEIEGLEEEEEQLIAQREELVEDLQTLRSRIDDLETTAVEQFNSHMDAILNLLQYGNIERVWIERIKPDGREESSAFELHIVRETDDGAVYEDTIDNLSESEREVVGLVVVLAGYLVHDVYKEAPFMLLDSLEAIDSERLADLIQYFADYAPLLLVALLPEDSEALAGYHDRITSDELS